MDLEEIVYGYIPLLIGIGLIVYSFYLSRKRKTTKNYISTVVIFFLSGLGIWILYLMLLGAYPTYTPHIAISLAIITLFIQKAYLK